MNPLYKQVAEKIHREALVSGGLAGSLLDSLNEIQRKYRVSKITAIKAADELVSSGRAVKIHGKGLYLSDSAEKEERGGSLRSIKRIVLVADEKAFLGRESLGSDIFSGALSRIRELSFPHRFEMPPRESAYFNGIPPRLNIGEGDGVVMSSTGMEHVIGWLMSRHINNWALADTAVIGARCAVSDNRGGMARLMDYLVSLGHRNFIFVPAFSTHVCLFNTSERMEAFIDSCARHGVKGTVFSCPDYAALLEAVRKTKENPVCVMFPQDSPALNFIETVRRQGLRVPEDVSVCGFDGYGSGAQSQSLLTTVRVNQFGLGVAAVDALLEEMPNPGGVFPWKRVKTELAEGQTVLKIKERAKL